MNGPSKVTHILMPRRDCQNVTFHGDKDCASVMKLSVLMGRVSWLAQYQHKGPHRRGAGGSELVGEMMVEEKGRGDMRKEP